MVAETNHVKDGCMIAAVRSNNCSATKHTRRRPRTEHSSDQMVAVMRVRRAPPRAVRARHAIPRARAAAAGAYTPYGYIARPVQNACMHMMP